MNKEEILQRIREEQQERKRQMYKVMDSCHGMLFVHLLADIRWWNKYMRYIEDNY
jgi:hypothetical protein